MSAEIAEIRLKTSGHKYSRQSCQRSLGTGCAKYEFDVWIGRNQRTKTKSYLSLMELFNIYPLFDVCPEKGKGSFVTDQEGQQYLDLYGGHGVISVGHSHPHYVKKVQDQLQKLGFYSN